MERVVLPQTTQFASLPTPTDAIAYMPQVVQQEVVEVPSYPMPATMQPDASVSGVYPPVFPDYPPSNYESVAPGGLAAAALQVESIQPAMQPEMLAYLPQHTYSSAPGGFPASASFQAYQAESNQPVMQHETLAYVPPVIQQDLVMYQTQQVAQDEVAQVPVTQLIAPPEGITQTDIERAAETLLNRLEGVLGGLPQEKARPVNGMPREAEPVAIDRGFQPAVLQPQGFQPAAFQPRGIEREQERLAEDYPVRVISMDSGIYPVTESNLRNSLRGREVGIKSSLKAQVVKDESEFEHEFENLGNYTRNLGMPREEPALSEISRPRSRRSGGPYGGYDMGGSTMETLQCEGTWNSETSVSGGAGHGPGWVGYTSQYNANRDWEASLNANKRGAGRRWNIETKPEAFFEPRKMTIEEGEEEEAIYTSRAEVEEKFQTSLRNPNSRAGKDTRRSDHSPRNSGSPRGMSPRSPRSPGRGGHYIPHFRTLSAERAEARARSITEGFPARAGRDLNEIGRELERRQVFRSQLQTM
jgi:hypothetical protein